MANRTYVMKVGGTSTGTPDAVARVAETLHQHSTGKGRTVAVVSTISGITGELLHGIAADGAGHAHRTVAAETLDRYVHAVKQVIAAEDERRRLHETAQTILTDYTAVCNSVGVLRKTTPRALNRAFSALARRRIANSAIAQSSPKYASSLWSCRRAFATAVCATHEEVSSQWIQETMESPAGISPRYPLPFLAQRAP